MTILSDTSTALVRPLGDFATDSSTAVVSPVDGTLGPAPVEPPCGIDLPPAYVCAHTPEEFAEAALMLEPRGFIWNKSFGTVKAALYRAFGKLLADFEARLCAVYVELLACKSVELLPEWETEYGTLAGCVDPAALSIEARQALVCQTRKGDGARTLTELQSLLRVALDCPILTLEYASLEHSVYGDPFGIPLTPTGGGICIRNIGPVPQPASVQSVFGPWEGRGADFGDPLRIQDPAYAPPVQCPIVYSLAPGDYDPVRYPLLICLMRRYMPAHIEWALCP
jgi:hypothetical protein